MALVSTICATIGHGSRRRIEDLVSSTNARFAINSTNQHGSTPLHDAVRHRRVEIIELLLEYQADPMLENYKGVPALHTAAADNFTDGIRLLVQCGYDANVDHGHPTALSTTEILQAPGIDGEAALAVAARFGHVQATSLLLELNADVHAPNNANQSALHSAAASGMPSTIDVLLAHRAHVNCVDSVGNTPLHVAALAGRLPSTIALLKRGANKYLRRVSID
jgi:uncharacterized protein